MATYTGMQLQSGSVTDPPYNFQIDPTVGIYLKSAGVMGIGVGGVEQVTIDSTGLHGAIEVFSPLVQAGSSGVAGEVDIYPTTASKGKIKIVAADNTGNTTTTLTVAAQAGAATYTVPDAGGSATFLLSAATVSHTMADAANIATNATTGTKIGTATSQKIGFWNATPVIQPAGAAQAAVTPTASITGADTVSLATVLASIQALETLANGIRTALVGAGLMKGAA